MPDAEMRSGAAMQSRGWVDVEVYMWKVIAKGCCQRVQKSTRAPVDPDHGGSREQETL